MVFFFYFVHGNSKSSSNQIIIIVNFWFSLQIPFSLTLRVWDLYLLKGERILIAMSYTILWIHRRKLMKMQMDELIGNEESPKNVELVHHEKELVVLKKKSSFFS